jgi:hypothetical protein
VSVRDEDGDLIGRGCATLDLDDGSEIDGQATGWVLVAWTLGDNRADDGTYFCLLVRKHPSKDVYVRVGAAEMDQKRFVGVALDIVVV